MKRPADEQPGSASSDDEDDDEQASERRPWLVRVVGLDGFRFLQLAQSHPWRRVFEWHATSARANDSRAERCLMVAGAHTRRGGFGIGRG